LNTFTSAFRNGNLYEIKQLGTVIWMISVVSQIWWNTVLILPLLTITEIFKKLRECCDKIFLNKT